MTRVPKQVYIVLGLQGPKFQIFTAKALFSSLKILQNFLNFPSHRIFRRMHGVLNIYENKN